MAKSTWSKQPACPLIKLIMNKIRLRKYYLDCVTENGDVAICYASKLSWRNLPVNVFSRLIYCNGKVDQATATTFRECLPSSAGNDLRWSCPKAGIVGTWTALREPLSRVLPVVTRDMFWNCIQPCASVVLTHTPAGAMQGLGYAEMIEFTVSPWDFAVDEMLWGRFVSATDSVVWIEWRGESAFRLVIHNGVEVEDGHIALSQVELSPALVLVLEEPTLLREGTLGETILTSLPLLRPLIPRGVRDIFETKWLSRGKLLTGGSVIASGWVIHERVQFRRDDSRQRGSVA
jgi:hypothetical protein